MNESVKRKRHNTDMSNEDPPILNTDMSNEDEDPPILREIKLSSNNNNLIRIPDIEYEKYIGYINCNNFELDFGNIEINRIINEDVVNNRVSENIKYYNKNKKFCDFGNAILSLNLDNPTKLYIIDGQHRLKTLEKIKNIIRTDGQDQIKHNIDNEEFKKISLNIAITIIVFKSTIECQKYLKHFQNQYHSDLRLFSFDEKYKREQLEKLINIFKEKYKERFIKYEKDLENQIKFHKAIKEVNKPNLSDGIVADFLKNEYLKIDIFNNPDINIETIEEISIFIRDNLNLKDNQKYSVDKKKDNCYFGYIRCNFESSREERLLIKKINEEFPY